VTPQSPLTPVSAWWRLIFFSSLPSLEGWRTLRLLLQKTHRRLAQPPSQRGKTNDFWATLWNSLSQKVWCPAASCVWEASKNDDKGTCELNKHDISPSNEDSEFHEQEGITFSRLLKVRCYVEIMITLFRRIFNFVTTDVRYHYSGHFTDFSLQSFTSGTSWRFEFFQSVPTGSLFQGLSTELL